MWGIERAVKRAQNTLGKGRDGGIVERDHAVGIGLARNWIVQRHGHAAGFGGASLQEGIPSIGDRQRAGTVLVGGGDGRFVDRMNHLASSFEVREEEVPVLHERSAKGPTELVA